MALAGAVSTSWKPVAPDEQFELLAVDELFEREVGSQARCGVDLLGDSSALTVDELGDLLRGSCS